MRAGVPDTIVPKRVRALLHRSAAGAGRGPKPCRTTNAAVPSESLEASVHHASGLRPAAAADHRCDGHNDRRLTGPHRRCAGRYKCLARDNPLAGLTPPVAVTAMAAAAAVRRDVRESDSDDSDDTADTDRGRSAAVRF